MAAMASTCTSGCRNDVVGRRVPPFRPAGQVGWWPESGGGVRVVDSASCRQIYLRSYTFCREEEAPPGRTKRCLRRVRGLINAADHGRWRRAVAVGKIKELSCSAALAVLRRFLACTTKVDVADRENHPLPG